MYIDNMHYMQYMCVCVGALYTLSPHIKAFKFQTLKDENVCSHIQPHK